MTAEFFLSSLNSASKEASTSPEIIFISILCCLSRSLISFAFSVSRSAEVAIKLTLVILFFLKIFLYSSSK